MWDDETKRLNKRKAEFQSARAGTFVDDDAFVNAVDPGAEGTQRKVIILLRRIIARDCGVPPEMLKPEDETLQIQDVMGDTSLWGSLLHFYGFDPDWFTHELKRVLDQYDLPSARVNFQAVFKECQRWWDPRPKRAQGKTLGDWTASLACMITKELGPQA